MKTNDYISDHNMSSVILNDELQEETSLELDGKSAAILV